MATLETKFPGLLIAAALSVIGAGTMISAQVPEPETVFYGRVVNRTTGQEYQVTSGTLEMTITGDGVAPLQLTTQLQAHENGKYSYILKIPHQAKSLDLTVDGGKLPLNTSDTGFENASIRVNGYTARPFGNGPTSFVTSQTRRGGVHRLDLELFNELEDTDGDGIPDWWEDLYGLDKQDPSDALLRWGDNLYTYREAFERGLNPFADDRSPELLTSELMVMEKGTTGLLLRTVASSSLAKQIRYTITGAPEGGSVILRNDRPDPKRSSRKLKAGDFFTQADVNEGRVEFVHEDASFTTTQIQFEITNRQDAEPLVAEVELIVYKPIAAEGRAAEAWLEMADSGVSKKGDTALDIWRQRATSAFPDDWIGGTRQRDWIAAFMLSRQHDYSVWDGSKELPVNDLRVPSAGMLVKDYAKNYLKLFGPARKHILFAGNGVVHLEGGMNDDILIAGVGETTLRGNGGADFFVVSDQTTIIEDFKVGEADLLDLSPLLKGWQGPLAEKVEVSFNAGNTWLRIAITESEEAVVILKDLKVTSEQLEALRRKGSVFSGAMSGVIYATNEAPVAVDDVGYVVDDQPVSISVLANDYDPDGDTLSVTNVGQGEFGSVLLIQNTVLYTPGPAFAGTDKFTYTLKDSQGGFTTGTVNISYPYPAAAGIYTTLLMADDDSPLGQLTLVLQSGGTFSVSLKVGKLKYSGKGSFDASGAAVVSLKAGKSTLELRLHLDLTDPTYPLTGSLIEDSGEGTLASVVVASNAKLVPTQVKKFTVIMQPPESVASLSGYGFATITVSTKYVARISGRLADGTAFTASVPQDKAGGLLWSTSLYKGSGWLLGQLSLTEENGEIPAGSFKWAKPEGTDAAFVKTLPAQVSSYIAPSVASVSALDFQDDADRRADLKLSGGGLAADLEVELTFKAKGDTAQPSTPVKKLSINRSSGLLTGTIVIEGASRSMLGTILQDENAGYGFFTNGSAAGAVQLTPQ